MSLLIKDMKMPKSCEKCQFFVWSLGVGQHCAVASNITFHAIIDGMDVSYECNGDCPLIELPPHGDLIDADKLVKLCDIMADKCDGIDVSIWHQFKTTVEWSPIVIPAEEDE